jgi:N-acyl-D-aspartate/D-glutamate deacylase
VPLEPSEPSDPSERSDPESSDEPESAGRRRLLIALGFGAASAVTLSKLPIGRRSSVGTVRERAQAPTSTTAAPVIGGAQASDIAPDRVFDQVISGGRVIDPETGFDQVANVGIDGPTIAAISTQALNGRTTINAADRVVAPGFIDMISYDPNDYGIWFKIGDGVTTNLGMHGMLLTADAFFSKYEGKSPCHYGGAYDNYYMRSYGGLNIGGGDAATPAQIDQLAADIETQLHQGWIGASFSPEYSPGITDDEIARQMQVAAKYGLPSFFHGRYSTDIPPNNNAKTLSEILDLARQTNSGVHVMHITSTGGTFQMQQSLATLQQARDSEHLDVTACLYPYTFWATYLQSARFNEGWQDRFHIDYGDLVIPGTGERLTKQSFNAYRGGGKNTLVAAYAIPEGDVVTGLQSPFTMVGSDAILEPGNNNHPRAAGCFTRTLGYYVRDQKTLSLNDALAKMTILPAKRLENKAPALRKKGRLQQGADADITIFDPNTVADRATVDNPAQEAAGIDYVLVMGQVVKSPEGLHKDVLPGQPIKSEI